MNIPFLSFRETNNQIRQEILQAFEQVFDNAIYIAGDKLEMFEKEYAALNNTSYAAGISNGLDALFIALKTLGVGAGDEVIVPSNTYIATLLAVSYTGAKPVLAEPEITSYNIDPFKIEAAITPATKAIIPVHLYGQACNMDAVMHIAAKHNLFVIEDNAQAHLAQWNGKLTGSWGHINATSFYPGKNLGALGDGGAVTTNDATWYAKAKMLRNYGSQKKYSHEIIGYNMRLDECQAAFLSVKLKYLSGWTVQRQQVASWYNELLQNTGDVILPLVQPGATHVYHLYVIRTQKRDELQQHLAQKNIGTLIHYPLPPHLQKAYTELGYKAGDFPIAESIASTCLSLPIWPGITKEEVYTITETIKNFF